MRLPALQKRLKKEQPYKWKGFREFMLKVTRRIKIQRRVKDEKKG